MVSTSGRIEPETHWIKPTPHVPNSKLPIIVYRNALKDTKPDSILATIEPNGWLKGGHWKAFYKPHFHSNCHECYGVVAGSTTYLLGKSPQDPDVDEQGNEHGLKLTVGKGDVFVFPAGISHASLEAKDDYEYIGFYPDAALVEEKRFDMNWGDKGPEETQRLAKLCTEVPVPEADPLYGVDGPLPKIWREAN
ncbi:uncharacterized protein K452DRAFT_234076 [Aplosporella prunicola CBS 121167]|uniref:Cupin type-1 domain-containing protein n=1 Tax=Aplosporella prunicola CBS 121167 TaxID=1176127 RepID=A0A6A6B2Z5_9PEZI|nr:uncharacterized protein K452DRAFT_234076 [Aplosporella prunicola CBS 121167]KAF2138420.1 hypothetical protein K452DRAFT_234076 [Aplosporella prunicola CBS 121167]